VHTGGTGADEKLRPDLPVGPARGEEPQHVELAAGQPQACTGSWLVSHGPLGAGQHDAGPGGQRFDLLSQLLSGQ
jgi:hypothetical protein